MSVRRVLLALALVAGCRPAPTAVAPAPPPRVCGWGGSPTGDALVLADLGLRAGQYNRVASAADSAAVAAVGGRVVHAFAVAVLRVEVPARALYALTAGPDRVAETASPVRRPARHDAAVQVVFRRPVTTDDVDRAWRAGGAVGGPPVGPGPVVSAVERPVTLAVADSLVGRVEALPAVDFVRAEAVVCGQLL